MPNPQLEDGYTPIANEIMEALSRVSLGGVDSQVILAIIRKTYGYHKKADSISISQLQELTGRSRRSIINALQNLEAKNMVTITRAKGSGNVNLPNKISFQKNHSLWVVQRISQQYQKQLHKQREKYQSGVVQRFDGSAKIDDSTPENDGGSAKKPVLVVQRTLEKGHFFAPTKDSNISILQKIDDAPPKKKRYFFSNILLTEDEHNKLLEKFGEAMLKDRLETLSLYKQSRGKKYASDYATVLSWERKDNKAKGENNAAHTQRPRQLQDRSQYTTPDQHRSSGQ